ncbi:MAG: alpha/beta hydrolase [Bacteroidetes bacterium]|nr:MAG: alpha/beta hydrolase [Bacteroidota bacterium]
MTNFDEIPEPVNINGERATYANEKYGPHERNTFDIWLAQSTKPTPLVIYIHGGGFTGGDKSRYFQSEDVVRFLDSGVSVATINYRFMNEPPFGILGSMNDSKRFVQFIRYHSEKYNIDKSRIACTGGSAGAGTALWLAFSDDMADPDNDDPVLRESTRLTCAGAFATQATYDIFQWDDILGFPLSKTPGFMQMVARAFGFKSAENIDLKSLAEIRENLDFLKKMNKNASPVFIFNRHSAGLPETQDDINHHPLHAKKLMEKAVQVGIEAVVYAPELGITDPSGIDLVDFFLKKLTN